MRKHGPTRPLVPVVLTGGIGSRLWPLSRAARPKQFHTLWGEFSLLQHSLMRAAAVTNCAPIVVANESHQFLVAEQCRAVGASKAYIALEPVERGTAAAMALGVQLARSNYSDPLVWVLPADHRIDNEEDLARSVGTASAYAAKNRDALLTFGIHPTYAETAYGYIETELSSSKGVSKRKTRDNILAKNSVLQVLRFVEKPDGETARSFVESGRFLWNSGMFLFDARACLNSIEMYCPDLARIVGEATSQGSRDANYFRPGLVYGDAPSGSFEVHVMQNAARAFVVPSKFGFADVGSWEMLLQTFPTDKEGNHFVGDVHAVDASTSLVHSDTSLVAAIGIRDIAIVATPDAVLVAHRTRLQDIRKVVGWLKASGRSEYHEYPIVNRSWGEEEAVGEGNNYRVKRLTVSPRATLSLRCCRGHSQHWVVVRGTAEVSCGHDTFVLRANDNIFIPRGTTHRVRNPGDMPLEIVEVRVGARSHDNDSVRVGTSASNSDDLFVDKSG